MIKLVLAAIVAAGLIGGGIFMNHAEQENKLASKASPKPAEPMPVGLELATFGSGCFWCTEAVFQQLKGVKKVVSGYTGGEVKNPTYEQICTGKTGHAEVIQITFDPKVISFPDLLDAFWHSHDPTTPNRQGNDHGPQYRSAVFFHSDKQKQQAEEIKKKLDAAGDFGAPIVTEITAIKEFYPAEAYHQNYFNDNPGNPYCAYVIKPKVDKVKKTMADRLKSSEK